MPQRRCPCPARARPKTHTKSRNCTRSRPTRSCRATPRRRPPTRFPPQHSPPRAKSWSGRAFVERDVRFIEAVGGFLAHGLEILRTRRTLEAENSRLRTHTPAADDIIGGSNAVIHLRQQILRAAPQPFTVLVQGESGSG